MTTQHLLLRLAFLLSVACLVSQQATARFGVFQPIPNVRANPYVVGICKFAVAEHNRESGSTLVFIRVVGGERQFASDGNIVHYMVILLAQDAGATKAYVAEVFDKPGKGRKLGDFMPATPSAN